MYGLGLTLALKVALKNKTPYESWFGTKPNVSDLRVFGCICFYHVPKCQRRKLDPKARKAIFVGYPDDTKGYKLYDLESKKFKRKEIQNVTFNEQEFHIFDESSAVTKDDKQNIIFPVEEPAEDNSDCTKQGGSSQAIAPDEPVATNLNIVEPIALEENAREHGDQVGDVEGRNQVGGGVQNTYEKTFMLSVAQLPDKRIPRPNSRYIEEESNIVNECINNGNRSLISDIDEPRNVEEALSSVHAKQWKDAMDSEHSSLIRNKTWSLVSRPKDVNIVGNRWVFKVKRKGDGSIDRFKARLVAQGFSQTYGVDYDEVFSPVVRFSTLRSLLALANANNWEIHQMDVTTAFLNGELDCAVFMEQPIGYVVPGKSNYVCKLEKSLYGLKQSARCWNATLHKYLESNNFQQSSADGCIYVKRVIEHGKFVILAVYVDDLIPVSNDVDMLNEEKSTLCSKFEMVDNGDVKYFLNLIIKRDREAGTLCISQPSYLKGVLTKFRMDNCNPVNTPLEQGTHYVKRADNEEPFDKQLYQQAIGCLTYASITTRPDISAAVGMLSTYMSDPSQCHWSGVKRILRYLKGTLGYGLKYTSDHGNLLVGFADADWAGDLDTRCSTSGYLFQIGGASVSWSSKRQRTVARSSTEAEYVALSMASQEAIWLRCLLSDLSSQPLSDPTIIHEDNNGAIELSKNAKNHNRTKHIDIAYHFTRERVQAGELEIVYCRTGDMTADVMTKGLGRVQFQKLRNSMGVCSVN